MTYYIIGSCLTFAFLVFRRARRERSWLYPERNFGPLILLSIAFIAALWPIFLVVAVIITAISILVEILAS